jgi:hypothetical protein
MAVVPVESYIGSLDFHRLEQNPNTASSESFFMGTVVNQSSNYIQFNVNPAISDQFGPDWEGADGKPLNQVRVDAKSAYAKGSVVLTGTPGAKATGNIPAKLERSLRLAENKDIVPLDIVVDGGLSTIWAVMNKDENGANSLETYKDDTMLPEAWDTEGGLADPDPLVGGGVTIANNWQTITNDFIKFVGEERKDCVFISDPIRHIFVQGPDNKVLSTSRHNFSQHVHRPLRNLYAAVNSNYACAYGNWVKRYDNASAQFVWLPFSGYQANIFANVDSNLQPWFAAAGLNNGIIRDIVDIAVNPTQKQRDLLYKSSINPIVFFPGDGYTVWGQKTLQKKPSAFDRINVRRLFLVLEKATLAIMKYFVFEPNTVFTRTRVLNVLSPIFDIAKNNEGLYDYMIVCDERNNTPNVIDNNEMVVDIYIKPVRIAEFILVNFHATRTDQDFNELL